MTAAMNSPIEQSNSTTILFAAASILLGAVGQLLLKVGAISANEVTIQAGLGIELINTVSWLMVGLICYCLALLTWLKVLAKWPLSVSYPLLSIGYILVYIGATQWPMIGEQASLVKTVGTLLIMLGVVLVVLYRQEAK